jgi:serine/threonine-protein kinase RsbT
MQAVTSDASRGGVPAVEVIARDEGPGIADIDLAMQDGYSTGRGLGLGLPGARRLMDEFEITSEVGVGTTIVMRKRRTR